MPILTTEGDDNILRMTKTDNVNAFGASLSLSYVPVRWFAIQPYYNFEHLTYTTPNQEVTHDLHNTGVSVQFLPKYFQIIWNGNFPMTLADGDIFTHYGFNMSASVLYKVKSMSVGLEYIYNPSPSRVYADIKDFSYSEETKWNNFKNLVSVKFTYYVHKGRSRNHAGKRFSNTDSDSGLININTAK